jgi:hypothetical protein
VALTINRTGKLVVQDAEAYQVLGDRVGAIEGILRGLVDVKGRPHQAGAGGLRLAAPQARYTPWVAKG